MSLVIAKKGEEKVYALVEDVDEFLEDEDLTQEEFDREFFAYEIRYQDFLDIGDYFEEIDGEAVPDERDFTPSLNLYDLSPSDFF